MSDRGMGGWVGGWVGGSYLGRKATVGKAQPSLQELNHRGGEINRGSFTLILHVFDGKTTSDQVDGEITHALGGGGDL